MYLQTKQRTCPPCGPFVVDSQTNDSLCLRCAKPRGAQFNKYHAEKKKLDGYTYDSGFEGDYAAQLTVRTKAGDIERWERQFPVRIEHPTTREHILTTKVDFMVYHKDGSRELVETKGLPGEAWKIKKKLIEMFWLPENLDCQYTVVNQASLSWRNYKAR